MAEITAISTVAAAAGLAIGVKLTRDGLKSVDAMTKLGRSLGATQAEMVALNATADLVGIAQSKMQSNVGAFTKRLGEAIDGSGQAVDALKKLGFTAEELAAIPLPEALALVAERTQMLGTAAERAAVESDLFSRAGIGMLTTTGDLAGAIRQATKDTQGFGVAVSQVDAAKIEAANVALDSVGSRRRRTRWRGTLWRTGGHWGVRSRQAVSENGAATGNQPPRWRLILLD